MTKLTAIVGLLALVLFASSTPAAQPAPVEQWGIFELRLDGPAEGNPYVDVILSARFTQGNQRLETDGFYDGDGVYRVRFSPPAAGPWQYETTSNREALSGKRGTFTVSPPAPGNHGPVRVSRGYHFAYADSTPYFQIGTTCYVWTHQTEELQQQTLKTLAASPFNKIRFCVFPKSYTYNQNEPPNFAFQRKADKSFDHTRIDPAFWRHFEGRIADLMKLGIEADLILWHPYDRWGFATIGPENDDRYLRYAIARLGAYRNVWWSLANEFDLMAPNAMKNHRGDKAMADWDRFFQILQKYDPYTRMRGIHNCRGFYDHTKPWVTHASIQSSSLPNVLEWRQQYRKPIVIDECCYEGNIPQGWGKISAEEMTRRFWIGAMRGGYVGHGETYLHPQDILWWSKGGVLHGQSPARIAFFKKILTEVAFHEFEPQAEPSKGNYLLAKEGETYFVYFTQPAKTTIRLAGERPYKVDLIDTWGMTITPLGTAQPGEFTFEPRRDSLLLRLTVYKAGEALRPEVKASASVNEGLAPLTVRFSTPNQGKVRWDFGDGATSDEASPTHIYREPGLYTATVTVTGSQGEAGAAGIDIAADRDSSAPIVQVGFATDEPAGIKLNGPVKRGDGGSFVLPESEPFGWVNVGEKPMADLEGLRSFTICGWVKPSSLKTGSGGNRIVFSLNRQSGGLDLVHLNDGRLRLAINEWPDQVKNDSSPKLRIGEWTFFAVSYDAAESKDNVAWYFGADARSAQLDRTTTYTAGRTGTNSGRLVIGNFNDTMQSYGLDRQFRGEIRGIRIFGSRISSRGALAVEEIRK